MANEKEELVEAQIDRQLVEAAATAANQAYAPYSNFPVGAALASTDGRILTGCNVENASYGLTICAERVALGKAVSEGLVKFQSLALYAPGGATPCGACRQVLHEFSPDLEVLITDQAEVLHRFKLRDMLPHSFELR